MTADKSVSHSHYSINVFDCCCWIMISTRRQTGQHHKSWLYTPLPPFQPDLDTPALAINIINTLQICSLGVHRYAELELKFPRMLYSGS